MFQHRSSFAVPFVSFFSEDDGKNPPVPPAKPEKPQFDDAQQKHINDLLAAERRDTETKVTQRLKDEADAAETKRQQDAARAAAEAKGEFETVKTSLISERDAAATERDALKDENAAITAYFSAQYAAALQELPEVITAFAPAEDASFAEKSAWLTKAQTQAAKIGSDPKPGNRPNPKPLGGGDAVKQATEQMRGRISI